MDQAQLVQTATQLCHDILTWIGFGTVVGLLAKAIMPGRDPGGAVATLMMGIGGSVVGCGVLAFFWQEGRVSPLTPLGFATATGGAFVLLFFYRLLGGRFFTEGDRYRRITRRPYYKDRHAEIIREE